MTSSNGRGCSVRTFGSTQLYGTKERPTVLYSVLYLELYLGFLGDLRNAWTPRVPQTFAKSPEAVTLRTSGFQVVLNWEFAKCSGPNTSPNIQWSLLQGLTTRAYDSWKSQFRALGGLLTVYRLLRASGAGRRGMRCEPWQPWPRLSNEGRAVGCRGPGRTLFRVYLES